MNGLQFYDLLIVSSSFFHYLVFMKRIILVGFMGAGKSTLGKKLASRLDVPFVDSDAEIEKEYNKTIGELFGEFGESHFREIEAQFINSLRIRDAFVLASGGGMPCYQNNMALLNELGTTFYLERTPKELMNRLINAKHQRPLIAGLSEEDLLKFIEDKLSEREEYYRQSAITLSREEQNIDAMERFTLLLHPQ
jgi:shikimate kinase